MLHHPRRPLPAGFEQLNLGQSPRPNYSNPSKLSLIDCHWEFITRNLAASARTHGLALFTVLTWCSHTRSCTFYGAHVVFHALRLCQGKALLAVVGSSVLTSGGATQPDGPSHGAFGTILPLAVLVGLQE